MDHQPVTEIDQNSIKEAQKMWKNFTTVGKYSVYVTAAILIILALIFVDFT
ncbi:MAG: aa3-type cytochrome c oxidase subunit IV [Alphaproteobacteria bacterium]|nr:aa3-type cytochrome c oxidase subunit IV [Alphaproteobacteria bacterium]